MALISLLIRQKASLDGLPHLLFHSSSYGLKGAVLVSHFSPDISNAKRGQKWGGDVQAPSRAQKADLLNRKIFVKINRFDYIKSKICTWQNHINQTESKTGIIFTAFMSDIHYCPYKQSSYKLVKRRTLRQKSGVGGSTIIHKRRNRKRKMAGSF